VISSRNAGQWTDVSDPAVRMRALVEDNYDFVWRSLRRLGLDPMSADDGAQQVFVTVSRKLATIRSGGERAYLFGVALRVASDARRGVARRREQLGDAVDVAADPCPGPDELLDERRARVLIDAALERLPDDLRVVFVLHELEEMSMSEIAEAVAIAPGTVASRLRRARQEFGVAAARLKRVMQPSVRSEKPSEAGRRRAVVASIAVACGLSATTTAEVGAAPAATGLAVAFKWLLTPAVLNWTGVAVVGGAVAIGVAQRPSRELVPTAAAHPPVAPPAIAPPPESPRPRVEPQVVPSPPPPAQPLPQARAARARVSPATPAPGLRDDLDLLDRARTALAAGDAQGALGILAAHDRTFPQSALAEEAEVLRVEALAAAGRAGAARDEARRFLARYPDSPHAGRVRKALAAAEATPE
jgi:RNA polymerase sigma-70 factor (ECF subfamily)